MSQQTTVSEFRMGGLYLGGGEVMFPKMYPKVFYRTNIIKYYVLP